MTSCYTDCLCLLAQTLARQNNPEEAVSVITRSYLSRSRQHDLYLNLLLANIYLQMSRNDDPHNYFRVASEMLQRSLRKNPCNVYLANGCGLILQRTGKQQAAMQVFKKVRESALNYSSCCINVAHLHLLEDRYHDAAGLYQTALQLEEGHDVELFLCLALALMRGGNHKEALEVLLRAQNLDPSVSM